MKVTALRDSDKRQWHVVEATEQEALKLIESLSRQLQAKNPNVGRHEFPVEAGGYFSVAVVR